MKKMTKELANVASEESLTLLKSEFPAQLGFTRVLLPRISFLSQDQVEGKGKSMKVTAEAGLFFTEHETKEVDENNKFVWNKEEIGKSLEGIIFFQRKQLKYYDSASEKYTSSPAYDNDNEVVPLFLDKKEIDRGIPAELQKKYPGLTAGGKPTSKLEVNTILYVLHKDEAYQVNLRGTSMYSYIKYARSVVPPSVVTKFCSEPQEKGTTAWNMMTFSVVRPITQDEVKVILEKIKEVKNSIMAEKEFYASKIVAETKADDDFNKA